MVGNTRFILGYSSLQDEAWRNPGTKLREKRQESPCHEKLCVMKRMKTEDRLSAYHVNRLLQDIFSTCYLYSRQVVKCRWSVFCLALLLLSWIFMKCLILMRVVGELWSVWWNMRIWQYAIKQDVHSSREQCHYLLIRTWSKRPRKKKKKNLAVCVSRVWPLVTCSSLSAAREN